MQKIGFIVLPWGKFTPSVKEISVVGFEKRKGKLLTDLEMLDIKIGYSLTATK